MHIMKKQGRIDQTAKLNAMLDTFKKKSKDYVFLINEDVKGSELADLNKFEVFFENDVKILKSLEMIFDNFVEPSDRLSLMTYGKNTRKLFNLVGI